MLTSLRRELRKSSAFQHTQPSVREHCYLLFSRRQLVVRGVLACECSTLVDPRPVAIVILE